MTAALFLLVASTSVLAEQSRVTISIGYGLNYLPIWVIKHDHLIEKHAVAMGLSAPEVRFAQLGGGAAANEALLSGSIDFAAVGVSVLIQIWNATSGTSNVVKAVAANAASPLLLNTTNPKVRSIKDFTEEDRIALPAIKVSLQATVLQMECAKVFGESSYEKLDPLTVSMPHQEATVALLSGGRGSISAHFGQAPFQEEELMHPNVHTVLSSFDVLGGLATDQVLITATKFRDANPTLYRAITAAHDEAMRTINFDKRAAARIFVEETGSKQSLEALQSMVSRPDREYSVVPRGIMKYAEFMYKTRRIKRRPAIWTDMFFPEIHERPGS